MRWRLLLVLSIVGMAGCGGSTAPVRVRRRPPPRPPVAARPAAGRRRRLARRRERAELSVLRRRALPIYCAGPRGRDVGLTFDDGPGVYTHFALKELRRAHARATFFLVKKSIRAFPSWPRREARIAAIGDHTETHPYLPGLAPAAAAAQIAGGRRAAERASGSSVLLFRPPYGAFDASIERDVRADGMVLVMWSIDSGDSNTLFPQDHAEIARRVERWIRPGSIVLFHENRGQTIRALRSILPFLRRRGLRPVSVPELLAADPPSAAQLRRGLAGCGATPPPIGRGD